MLWQMFISSGMYMGCISSDFGSVMMSKSIMFDNDYGRFSCEKL